MAKKSFYFQHDFEPTSDHKMQALIGEYGAEGYGIYWRLVEILHSEPTHKLGLKPLTYRSVGGQLSVSPHRVETFIKDCIDCFDLFKTHDDFFYCERVIRNIEMIEKTKNQRSMAGKASAEAKKNNQRPLNDRDTTVEQPLNDRSTKEKKRKESIQIQNTVVLEPTKEESVVVRSPVFNKFFEMFKRSAGTHFSDAELVIEVGKFQNRYPNVHPNVAGALVNTWVGNIGRDLTKSWQKEPELTEYQKNYLAEKEKYKNRGSGIG